MKTYTVQLPLPVFPAAGAGQQVAHIVAGERYEVIIDHVYSPGGPPPAGEPITDELRVFLVAK
jgi:hypothetical protein